MIAASAPLRGQTPAPFFGGGSTERGTRFRAVMGFGLYLVVYYFGYHLGMSFSQVCASPFWFPDSILLCALLLSRPAWWWVFVLGTFLLRWSGTDHALVPRWFILTTCAIDAVKGIATALILRRVSRGPVRLNTMRQFISFCLFAVVLVPAVAAVPGAAVRLALGDDFCASWWQWFLGNVLAHLVITPGILFWAWMLPKKLRERSRKKWGEALALAVGLIMSCYMAFHADLLGDATAHLRFYAPVPFLFWAALRFGMFGASGAIVTLAAFAVEAALHGRPAFASLSPAATALALQNFLLLRAVPIYVTAILIEQRDRVEHSLRESEALNRGIIDSFTSRIVILDGAGRVIAANEAWQAFIARTLSPTIGIGSDYLVECRRALRADDLTALEVMAGIESVLLGRAAKFQMEYFRVTPDGGHWYETWVLPLRKSGEGVVVNHRDITERKKEEIALQELRREQTHVGRVTMLGQLAASMAHELGQPLGSILSNSQAGLHYLRHDPPNLKEVTEILRDIVREDQRAAEIIHRMRMLLKRGEPQLATLDVNQLVNEVASLLRFELMRRATTLELQLDLGLGEVRGDRVPLQQVLINLLLNGSDAMHHLPSRERRLVLRTVREGEEKVVVSVSDCGVGIRPDDRLNLFTPFFTTKREGLGVGLAICKSIIDAHGGQLWAENNPERGATFYFALRRLLSADPSAARAQSPAEKQGATKAPSDSEHL